MNPLHILVVSADPARRDDLVSLLQQGAHRSVAVGGGAAAVEHIEQGLDAVVLDLTLPDLDLETLRRALRTGEEAEPDSLDAAERRHLSLVLRHTGGNKRKAAHILGISRSTLLNKVRKYGLEGR
ncbi:MAG TPA: helix-turn-helix domain-containing protein [Gemmatimonadales bacterium]|nr:helix-turn-helix domain-containing protein [Gemmatimonadales bacterium]